MALKATYDSSTTALKTAEDLLQSLMTGLASNDESSSSGFMGQLAAAKALASSLGSEADKAKARIDHLQKEIKDKEPKAKKAASQGQGLIGELEQARKEKAQLEASLAKLDWDESKEAALRDRKDAESAAVRSLLEQKDRVKSRLAGLEFDYADPYRGFDRSAVKGLIANLIHLEPEQQHAATALEICAGGRLYNVVVADEKVGSDLLKKGQLRKRVTIIPLTKINPNVASNQTMSAVKKVSSQTNLALSLVGYENEVSKAMEYVFGNTLICPDKETAALVTFHREVRMRSVTLEGDVYDPSGTLSGGSRAQGGGVLVRVQELHKVETELRARKAALDQVEREWEHAREAINRFKQANKQLELKAHEVGLLEERVQESNATRVSRPKLTTLCPHLSADVHPVWLQIIAEVDGLKAQVAELTATVSKSKEQQKAAVAEAKRIEKEMAEFKSNRGSKLDQIKADIKSKKADLAKHTTQVKTLQREVQTAELELGKPL